MRPKVYHGKSKAIIFDLDGVLVESKDLHYEALNEALRAVAGDAFVIPRGEHESIYDGLSTNQKLVMLSRNKGLPEHLQQAVFIRKQEITLEMFSSQIRPDKDIKATLAALKHLGFQVAVASNCIRASVVALLEAIGVIQFVDAFFSNEDVKDPKPAPDLYVKAAAAFACRPDEVIVIEDSVKGFEAAIRAGANLCRVRSPHDVRLPFLLEFVAQLENRPLPFLNVVIPLARPTHQFWLDGPDRLPSEVPVQLMDVQGKCLLRWMCDLVKPSSGTVHFIFIVRESHVAKYHLNSLLPAVTDFFPTRVLAAHSDRLGAMSSVMLARDLINTDVPLLVYDGGHYLRWEKSGKKLVGVDDLLSRVGTAEADIAVTVHEDNDPRWSYVQTEPNSTKVVGAREKFAVSNKACTGMYLWGRGTNFVSVAEQIVAAKATIRGQFYLAPMINFAVAAQLKVTAVPVAKNWSLRTMSEVTMFRQDVVPGFVEGQLQGIYSEMIPRNLDLVRLNGIKYDGALNASVDNRRCHAAFTLFDGINWFPTSAFMQLEQEVHTILGSDQILYRVIRPNEGRPQVGGLHFTLMQLIKFELFDACSVPEDYYEVLQAMLVSSLTAFEINFHSIALTPTSLLLLGTPSVDVNHARGYLRREMARIGYPLFEPYKSDLVHATIARFSKPMTPSTIEKLSTLVNRFPNTQLGRLNVSHITLAPGSWRMNPSELHQLGNSAVVVELPPY
jgi:HAD superfamily hydrolase (TIGR01509 family)